jgi:hypothetical protein
LLDDPEMLKAVTALNHQIQEFAPILNSPTLENVLQAKASNAEVPIATMVKQHNGHLYIFAVAMRNAETRCTFSSDLLGSSVDLLGEERKLSVTGHTFADDFKPYEARLYRSR